MIEFSKEIVEEHLQKAPKIIQNILSDNWINSEILKISQEEKIRIDKTNNILNLVLWTLLGLIKPENFFQTFISNTGIDNESALKIIKKIEERIFNKVREIITEKLKEEELQNQNLNYEENKQTNNTEKKNKTEEEEKILTLEDLEKSKKYKNLTFKEKFEILAKLKKSEKKKIVIDPYREPIE